MPKKVALAYSGGLDTSVLLTWIQEHYRAQVVAVSVDVGEEQNYEAIRQKALSLGAVAAEVVDARQEFARDFIFPALKANAVYEGKYPISTALARPLISKVVGQVAVREGCDAVAHGSTGKGNDQVRFEVSFGCLYPKLQVLAPVREWELATREQEMEYAANHGIPVPVGRENPYSIDTNLWGKSTECGVLEDPWAEPPEEVFTWTRSPEQAPQQPAYLEIGFEQGVPVSLDGKALDPVALISRLNQLGGEHGVGRIDMVENRLVGIKSRETYECPAAAILLAAHRELEALTLDRETMHFKEGIGPKYAELVYYGLWYSPLRAALDAFVDATQRPVSGEVRVKLHQGNCTVVGRRSPHSLYRLDLATYEEGDKFDQKLARGFVELWGLPARVAARMQGIK